MTRVAGGLTGRQIAVTRAADQATGVLDLLAERGATAIALPTIAIAPPASYDALDVALRSLDRYSWIAFTSANAVAAVANRLQTLGIELPASIQLAAVGAATSRALEERLRAPDFVPREASAAALGRQLPTDTARVLFPRGDLAGESLPQALRDRGATVDDVVSYRTVAGPGASELAARLHARSLDAILFMSGSSIRHLLDALGAVGGIDALAAWPALICIGPETAQIARASGLAVDAVAEDQTAEAIVDAVERWFSGDRHG